MSRRLTRQELKTDEVADTLASIFLYLESHMKQILAGIAAVLVLILIGTGVYLYREGRETEAQEVLAELLPPLPAPDGTAAEPLPTGESVAGLEALLDDFGGTAAARVGTGYLGSLLASEGEIEPAQEAWNDYLASGDSDLLSATVQINLWEVDRQQGMAQEVATELERRLHGDSSLPADLLLYQLAVTYDALDDPEEARVTLQRLLDEHPTSPWAVEARRRGLSAVTG